MDRMSHRLIGVVGAYAAKLVVVLADSAALLASVLVALALRFEYLPWDRVYQSHLREHMAGLPVALAIYLAAFGLFRLYRCAWRFAGLEMLWGIVCANTIGVAGLVMVQLVLDGRTFPRSVLVMVWVGGIVLTGAERVLLRVLSVVRRHGIPSLQMIRGDVSQKRAVILGAGSDGVAVLRTVRDDPELRYSVVGFLDDDAGKHGQQIHGIDVLGPIEDVKRIAEEYAVDELLIAMPSASRERLRRVVELCQGTNLRFKTLPALTDLLTGRATVKEIRDVDINDLLGRPPVRLDDDQIAAFIRGRVVMVTGAGGSIGSEMCRQIARFEPRQLLLVEQAEPSLFQVDCELRRSFPAIDLVPRIADIADRGRMEALFREYRPSAVFHAAAHKHVPMMELNPGEALKNNIRGTRTVADAAHAAGVDKFVMISTDKAVNPTSIMGCSKRVAEMYIQGLSARSKTQFVTVRFGNVLGSSGSVIPIFREQIARGGPVTVTHPEMVRYFMTIPEAAQLVLQAASMGRGGEIFVLDMGEQVKIVDLAREMITLSGFRPDVDIRIVFTGLRPGEKLYEELAMDGENVARTAHPKVGIWQNVPIDWDTTVRQIDALLADADGLDRAETRRRLKEIVPEFYLEPPAPPPLAATAPAPAEVAASPAKVAPA